MSDFEVAVIGSGPAGAAAAIVTQDLGLRTVVIARDHPSRRQVGLSLPAKAEGLLAGLGLKKVLQEAGFMRSAGTTSFLGLKAERQVGRTLAYHLNRNDLERVLLERVESAGTDVRFGAVVRGAELRAEGGRLLLSDGTELAADYVIDASGRAGVLSRYCGHKERLGAKTAVLSVRVPAAALCIHAGHPEDTLFELSPTGWIWTLAISPEEREVNFGLDAGAVPKSIGDRRRWVASSLAQSQLFDWAMSAEVDPIVSDGTVRQAVPAVGPRFALAGDAASCIDPLTAHGVYKAIQEGMAAGAVANTALRYSQDAEHARRFYQRFSQRMIDHYRDVASSLYLGSAFLREPFWAQRVSASGKAFAHALDKVEGFLTAVQSREAYRIRLSAPEGLQVASRPVIREGRVRCAPALVMQVDREERILFEECTDLALYTEMRRMPLDEMMNAQALRLGESPSPELGRRLVRFVTRMIEEQMCDYSLG